MKIYTVQEAWDQRIISVEKYLDWIEGPETGIVYFDDNRPIYSACGSVECRVSSGICESITFGSGELDFNGYWETPCGVCARDWERRNPEDGEAWPFQMEESK